MLVISGERRQGNIPVLGLRYSCAEAQLQLSQAPSPDSALPLTSRDASIAPSSGKLSIQTLGWAPRQLYQSVHCRNYPANCFQDDEIRAAAAASLDHQCSWWGWNIPSSASAGAFIKVPTQGKVLQDPHWILGVPGVPATWNLDLSPNINSQFSTRSMPYVWSHCKGLSHKTMLGNQELSACRHLDVFYNEKSCLNQRPHLHCLSNHIWDLGVSTHCNRTEMLGRVHVSLKASVTHSIRWVAEMPGEALWAVMTQTHIRSQPGTSHPHSQWIINTIVFRKAIERYSGN